MLALQLGRALGQPLRHHRDRESFVLELWIIVAQRANVLMAEGSSEVAQEHENQRTLAP
jgi:hypothetical protein